MNDRTGEKVYTPPLAIEISNHIGKWENFVNIEDKKERSAFAKQLAASYMSGSRQTNTQSYDAYGFPRSSSRRMSSMNFYNQDDTP
jgi:hypothetical protein